MRTYLLTATSVMVLAFAAAEAQAQTIDYGSLEQLFDGPVTTSATGSPQRASEVPATMEIITAEDIRRSGAKDIPGVLRHVAGVDVINWSNDGADVGVRGYNQAFSPRLLVLIDGRQVYADYYGFTPWSTLPVELGAIRQIEVVKGPNSALFGFNAVGGVINIITYNPLYDDVNTVSLTGGTQKLASGSVVATTKVGNDLGLRLSAGGRSDDDFTTRQSLGDVGIRRGDNRGAIDVEGVGRLTDRIQYIIEASHSEADEDTQTPTNTTNYIRYGTNSVRGSVIADSAYGLIQGSVYSNWIQSEFFSTNSPTPLSNFRNQVTVVQLQDVFKLGDSHTIRLSGEYRHNTVETTPVTEGHVFYDVLSGGAMWNWKITSTVELTNAFRVDQLSLGRNGFILPTFPLANSAWDRTITEPSFNSGLVWKASDDDTLRLTAARGVQVPSLVNFGGLQQPSPPVNGLPTLDPTIVMNYELGWDRSISQIGGQFRANAFYQHTDDVIAFLVFNSQLRTFLPANIGSTEAAGLELSFKGTFRDDWRWGVSYTPEMITDHTGYNGTHPTDFQHTTPTHVVNANLGWAKGPWEVDSFLRYESSFYAEQQDGNIVNPALTPIRGYVSVDGRVGYKLTDWATLALSGQNITQSVQAQSGAAPVERRVLGSITMSF